MTKEEFCSIYDIAVKEYYDDFIGNAVVDFSLSSDFKKKIKKLISRQKKPYWVYVNTAGKRVAVVLAALVALSFATLSVKAARNGIIEQIKKIYDICIDYAFKSENKNTVFIKYAPEYIPESLVPENESSDYFFSKLEYSDGENSFEFTQIMPQDLIISYDTEHSTPFTWQLGDIIVEGIRSNGFISLNWQQDDYVFTIESFCELSDEEIINIIKSVKPAE